MPDTAVAEPSMSDLRAMLSVPAPEVEVETPAAPAKAEKPAPAPAPDASNAGVRDANGKFVAAAEPADTPGVTKRIGKALEAKREAEARATAAETELAELKAKPGSQPAAAKAVEPAQPAAAEGKPDINKFDSYELYNEALVDYKLAQKDKTAAKTESDRKAADAAAAVGVAWNERVELAKANPSMLDYEEKMAEAAEMPISRAMHETIIESERGPEVAYFLASRPEEAARIAKLNPLAAARELGKIEAALPSPDAPAKPAAKALPKPPAVAGGSHAPTGIDLDTADVRTFKREFAKRLNAAK